MAIGVLTLSKMVITASVADWSNPALLEFKRLTGVAATTVKAVSHGQPLMKRELFLNNHPDVARILRGVIALDRAQGLAFGYYELGPEEDFATAPLDHCRIDADVLANILAAADGQFN